MLPLIPAAKEIAKGRQSMNDFVLDARGLEPPEPMLRTMAALDQIGPAQTLLVLLPREPYPLYRALEINGFSWQTRYRPDGTVEVLIRHRQVFP
ncbi:MAG: DUF2249 domain-containing protein [Candidatus Accumulibacter sp. UW26]